MRAASVATASASARRLASGSAPTRIKKGDRRHHSGPHVVGTQTQEPAEGAAVAVAGQQPLHVLPNARATAWYAPSSHVPTSSLLPPNPPGPQATLWGRELTACVPAGLEQFLLHSHRCGVMDVSYGPRGNPGVNGLGLVVRLQEAPRGVVTRPVMVGRAWADRCADDWEGAIPECEWVGRQWPYPGGAETWPPPGHETHWGDWPPPF